VDLDLDGKQYAKNNPLNTQHAMCERDTGCSGAGAFTDGCVSGQSTSGVCVCTDAEMPGCVCVAK